MAHRVVVVGGGQAGAALVARLRNDGFTGAVTLIGDEPVPPYQRPPLSKKYLLGEMAGERLYLKPASFYDDQEIELVTGTPVAAIDRAAREVVAGDRRIPYDSLALTTGALPRLLPAAIGGALGGVYPVRTLADVDAMAPEVVAGRRVLIIGGLLAEGADGHADRTGAAHPPARRLARDLGFLARSAPGPRGRYP
jgi:3-phenylpropionate/trans-cinnamate dioxygenase ferredoxin reductase subunit